MIYLLVIILFALGAYLLAKDNDRFIWLFPTGLLLLVFAFLLLYGYLIYTTS